MNGRMKSMLVGLLLFSVMLETAWAFDHSHRLFDGILKQVVVVNGSKSRVRYGWIKNNPGKLNRYIQEIESVTRAEFGLWSEKQQKAFLINAYNALTIKLILSKYPDLGSIKDLGGFFSGPWKVKFFRLFGEEQHLDHIE